MSKTPSKKSRPDHVLARILSQAHGYDALFQAPNGETLPILAQALDIGEPDNLLGDLIKDERTFPQQSPELTTLQTGNAQLWNGPTYVYQGLQPDTSQFICSTGKYFDAVTTCFELRAELKRAAERWPDDSSKAWEQMPKRNKLLAKCDNGDINDWLWRGEGRSASLSISCLLVVNDGERLRYGVAKRSLNVADEPGLNAVVPSMAFQPMTADDPHADYSISDTVFRELAEELFSLPEALDSETATWSKQAPIIKLRELIEQGQAQHRLTGIMMNLEDLRPDILTLLFIPDPSWFTEFESSMALCQNEYDTSSQSALQPLDEWLATGLDKSMPPPFCNGNGTVASTACVALGAPVLQRLLAQQEA